MGKYSRTAKYEELRNNLQNDVEEQGVPRDLSKFANRLNKIDSEEFQGVSQTQPFKEPTREKPNIWLEDFFEEDQDDESYFERELEKTLVDGNKMAAIINEDLIQDERRAMENTQKMEVFNNEYLDEYLLDEVKSYSRDLGLTTEEQLQATLLREIRGEAPLRKQIKPLGEDTPRMDSFAQETPEETKTLFETARLQRWGSVKSESQEIEEDVVTPNTLLAANFLNEELEMDSQEDLLARAPQKRRTSEKFEPLQVSGEKTAQELLYEETTKIKVELGEYKENLEEMEEKFKNSNRILNFVLIFFILMCVVVIGIALYWILLNRGVI